jgi:hypothetical protein
MQSLKTCIAWPVAMASFTTDSIILYMQKQEVIYIYI